MYDKNYYKKHEIGSYHSAFRILKYVKSFIDFHSAVDLGCGMGTWCKSLIDLGIQDYFAIDNHEYDSTYMLISAEKYMHFDLSHPLSLSRRFDLAISVEVGEHIDKQYSDIYIRNLCLSSDIVLFSAALSNQGGTGHINEQPSTYWENIFTKYGYRAIDCIRPYFWNDEQIEIWYRNNCIIYMNPASFEKYFCYIPEIKYPLNIVHPSMLKRILHKKGIYND